MAATPLVLCLLPASCDLHMWRAVPGSSALHKGKQQTGGSHPCTAELCVGLCSGCLSRVCCMQIILSADMSTNGADDGSNLFPTSRQNDSPHNTIVGMANEIQNNGYTMALMNGDLAYAE